MLIRSNPRLSRNRRNVEMLALCALFMALAAGLVSCTKEQAFLPEQETLAPEVPGHTKAAPVPNQMLVSGLHGTVGSTVGPDGYLYVTEGLTGEITRIDPTTGDFSTYASGLPTVDPAIGLGGPVDVVFRNGTAYALVILVAADVGGSDTVGIYRIDGPSSHTVMKRQYFEHLCLIRFIQLIAIPLRHINIAGPADTEFTHDNRLLVISKPGDSTVQK